MLHEALSFLPGHLCSDFNLVFAFISPLFDPDVALLLVVQTRVLVQRRLDLPLELTLDRKAILLVLHLLLENSACVGLLQQLKRGRFILAPVLIVLHQSAALLECLIESLQLRLSLLLKALCNLMRARSIDFLGQLLACVRS